MILEKDFLYRVPVKNVLVTTPRQLVRNPEILVDVEGGEFMHGNILDANSTNKLINQSVKDAVDNKLIESGYVTKDLLEAETTRATELENSLKTLIGAETSARTKGDEDLSSKIKAEQTRAEGKEKEISDKLAIVNGDSNTEGSFRKAIADVVAAAPEDLDTLKEIADKLAGNDDLHTALNQAITEKADASALLNEVTRATGAESGLQAAIATKADATALSNYVLTTALNLLVDTLKAAIRAKLNAGNYIECENYENGTFTYYLYDKRKILFEDLGDDVRRSKINGSKFYLEKFEYGADYEKETVEYSVNGITSNKHNSCLATSDGTFKPISDFVLKTELPTVPTKTSQLTNDSNFITAADVDFTPYATTLALTAVELKVTANTTALEGKLDKGNYVAYDDSDDNFYTLGKGLTFGDRMMGINIDASRVILNLRNVNIDISSSGLEIHSGDYYSHLSGRSITLTQDIQDSSIKIDPGLISSTMNEANLFKITPDSIILGNEDAPVVSISSTGIKFAGRAASDIPVAGGEFVKMNSFVLSAEYNSKIKSLEARIAALEAKLPEAAA